MLFKRPLPIVVILGPTASGKTSLGISLAKQFGGEIICADSRTIYRYTDIGTAKPTTKEMDGVPHWAVDLIEPDESYSAADFKKYALKKIQEIRRRKRIPFVVGGTGLYIDSLIFDYKFVDGVKIDKRDRLNKLTLEELHAECKKLNVILPENSKNKRYVIRAIERSGKKLKRRKSPSRDVILVGIKTEKEILKKRIGDRAQKIFDAGAIDEAIAVSGRFGWDSPAMTGIIYKLIRRYLNKEITYENMVELFRRADWQLAKRQMTWFKRNIYIKWFDLEGAEKYLRKELAKYK